LQEKDTPEQQSTSYKKSSMGKTARERKLLFSLTGRRESREGLRKKNFRNRSGDLWSQKSTLTYGGGCKTHDKGQNKHLKDRGQESNLHKVSTEREYPRRGDKGGTIKFGRAA